MDENLIFEINQRHRKSAAQIKRPDRRTGKIASAEKFSKEED